MLGATTDVNQFLAENTKVSVLYDPATLQAVSLIYGLHPDGDDVRTIPIRVDFSDFRSVGGISLPYRITRQINGTVQLTIQATSVSLQ